MGNEIVKWYAWHPASFEKAEREEKALFLLLAHEGCIWCERMEEESFSDGEIVGVLQRDFVPIRVDSYERPDIARFVHTIFTQMTGREANDPLCLFLSPEKIPLYAATYMPDRDREGMMGLRETLALVGKKYQIQKMFLIEKGKEILNVIAKKGKETVQATRLDASVISTVSMQIKTLYDSVHGGFGERPKFPRYAVLNLLMDCLERKDDPVLREILETTLKCMVTKGLRDTEDGGFHPYCTDAAWEEPYPGKLLYDNALMARILLRASLVLDMGEYRIWGLQTIAFIHTKLMQDGLFAAYYGQDGVKDRRVIVSWNAMAITALFRAGEEERIYRQMAVESLAKLLEYTMRKGVLYHSFLPGEMVNTEAFLEDYAYLSETLLLANDLTGEAHYLDKAAEVIHEVLKHFFNAGQWYYSRGEMLLYAQAEDSAYPSALAVMAEVLTNAAKRIDPAYEKFAQRTLEVHSYILMREPLSMPQLSRVLLHSV